MDGNEKIEEQITGTELTDTQTIMESQTEDTDNDKSERWKEGAPLDEQDDQDDGVPAQAHEDKQQVGQPTDHHNNNYIAYETLTGSEEWLNEFWEESFPAKTEMLQEDKKAMYDAVMAGDVEQLDDLLDRAGADINMTWFDENLLMAAIRAKQQTMAEFLLDNGVDKDFTTSRFETKSDKSGVLKADMYVTSCRQMAYDSGMIDLVYIIDEMSGDSWNFKKPVERFVRKKRPLVEKVKDYEEDDTDRSKTPGSVKSPRQSQVQSRASHHSRGADISRPGSRVTICDVKSQSRTSVSALFGDTSGFDTFSQTESSHSGPRVLSLDNLLYPNIKGPRYRKNKAYIKRQTNNVNHMTTRDDSETLESFHQTLRIPQRIFNRELLTDDDPFGPNELEKLQSQHSELWATSRKPKIFGCSNSNLTTAKARRKISSAKESQKKRIVSPWKADNPEFVAQLSKRAQSAPSSVAKARKDHPEPAIHHLDEDTTATLPVISPVVRCNSNLYQNKSQNQASKLTSSRPNTNASKRTEWDFEGMENYLSSDHYKQFLKNKENLRRMKENDNPHAGYSSPRICKQNWQELLHNKDSAKSGWYRRKKQSPAGWIKTTAIPQISVSQS